MSLSDKSGSLYVPLRNILFNRSKDSNIMDVMLGTEGDPVGGDPPEGDGVREGMLLLEEKNC